MNKLYLTFTRVSNIYFTLEFTEPVSPKLYYNICSSLNSLQLEIYSVYSLNYENSGWIFIVKDLSKITDATSLMTYTLDNYGSISQLLFGLRDRLMTKLRNDKHFTRQEITFNEQVKFVSNMVGKNQLFLHTSLKTCNRMKKQRLTISEKNRATTGLAIINISCLFEIMLYELGWLTSPSFIEYFWKITQSVNPEKNIYGEQLTEELETSITLENSSLELKL